MTDSAHDSRRGAGLFRYVKEAFLFRWNLLFFLGAAVGAALCPNPDVLLPLVGAAELAYLAGLTSMPRFRAAIDAKAHAEATRAGGEDPGQKMPALQVFARLLQSLDPPRRLRFAKLRERCLQMRHIAHGVRGQIQSSSADEMRTPALDRLLWGFLRLLASELALSRFLSTTDRNEIKNQCDSLRTKLAAVDAGQPVDERISRALKDSLATAELRLDNFEKANGNAEFVAIELNRIENKIQALAELAVNHQDPDYISGQVDSLARNFTETEQAIRDLNEIDGLADEIEGPPPILDLQSEKASG
ncbi:MAG: hypothetical protein V2A73_14015 [Pseudomonadota bacterium]